MTPQAGSEEIKLVARARRGDLRAFEGLYDLHKGPVYRTALAITGDRLGAEEILLTPEQDAIAVQQLRKHYLIEEQA